MNITDKLLNITSPYAKDRGVARKYAEHLAELFDVLVPERIGEGYDEAIRAEDYSAAVRETAAHFRAKQDFKLPAHSSLGAYNTEEADDCARGIATAVGIRWEFPDGEIDFLFNPTFVNGPVNHEWLWQYNRHGAWGEMARAYRATGDERYARAFSEQVLKWIAQTDIPERWNDAGSAWRTIECGIRLLGSWQRSFDGFKCSPSVDDAVLLLFIASMHRQSAHLIAHPTARNWLMMEATGVYTFSSLFGELSDAEESGKTAANYLLRELEEQILPDGMHNELSPDYQWVVLNCASSFYSVAKELGREAEIPERFSELMKMTTDAAIKLSTPAFTQPRTNDCYTMHTDVYTRCMTSLFGETPEYRFVNTCRAEGTPPCGETASAILPYAGFAVMRSDWGKDAAYLCFDVGPLGAAHEHQDMLNINIYKGSEELIYDDGGGQYDLSRERKYAVSAYAHNSVLVDGLGQDRSAPKVLDKPVEVDWTTNARLDYAAAVYDSTYGKEKISPATHRREVCFLKPDIFCVSDTLTSVDGKVHDYELLFQVDTTEVVPIEGLDNAVVSKYGREYDIAIIPCDTEKSVELTSVCAQDEPTLRGWYNGRNDKSLHAATTVSRCVKGVRDCRFNTLLIPVRSGDPLPTVTKKGGAEVTVTVGGRQYDIDFKELKK